MGETMADFDVKVILQPIEQNIIKQIDGLYTILSNDFKNAFDDLIECIKSDFQRAQLLHLDKSKHHETSDEINLRKENEQIAKNNQKLLSKSPSQEIDNESGSTKFIHGDD